MLIPLTIKYFLGIFATVISFLGYIPYFRDIFKGKTKPHAFTWLVWGILTLVVFVGQINEGAGAGSWILGSIAIISFIIFVLAFKMGEKNIVFIDWLSLAGAGVALFLLFYAKNPLGAIILVVIVDALGYLPTFRKSYSKPYQETIITFSINSLKFLIAIFALEAYTLITLIYPVYLTLANGSFVMMLVIRRRQLSKPTASNV